MTAQPWLPGEAGTAARRHAPATLRNREAIAAVLADELPGTGLVLEIASGSGEHALFFAEQFPALLWQPSDPDPAALASIAAWQADRPLANMRAPLCIDAAAQDWGIGAVDAMLCINMLHISPWEAAMGLVAGAARILPPGAPLILYGPFLEKDVPTAPSNLDFDASLKARNPLWGLRDRDDVAALASAVGLDLIRRVAMPANNVMLIFRRTL